LRDWQQAGLLKPSLLKPLIATLEQTQIIKPMGQFSPVDLMGLQQVLDSILGQR
jgi:mRNA interferase MazF